MPVETPIPVNFGADETDTLNKYVDEMIRMHEHSTKALRTEKAVEWRKLVRGTPREEHKSFPWKNASNVVIQLIGTHADQLLARIMGGIYELMPLWYTELLGEWSTESKGEEQRQAVEHFLNYVGLEPSELDLYRVESKWFGGAIEMGTKVIKFPWEECVEHDAVSVTGGESIFKRRVLYEGPRPEPIPFEDFLISNSATNLETAHFKAHIRHLKKFELLDRVERGLYEKAVVDDIINTPDRYGDTNVVRENDQDRDIQAQAGSLSATWDIYECWFPYYKDGKKLKLIVSYHKATQKILRAIFNFYPEGMEPFEDAKLGTSDDSFYGYGLAEMLNHYQEDVTGKHNRRNDNETLANTSILRVGRNSKLDAIFSIYPNALIPADKDEIEKIQLGSNYPTSVGEEELTFKLAAERSGVGPAVSGGGGGVTNPKKGVYSAMGTFAVMQEGNRRVNLRVTDMRMAHIRLGRKLLLLYSNFGVGQRINIFGNEGALLQRGLESFRGKRLGLAIRPATGSVNRELEKQNDMMLSQVMARHYQGVGQYMQAMMSPEIPPEFKQYLQDTIAAMNELMKHILRNFGHDDTSRLIPVPAFMKQQSNGGGNGESTGRPASVSGGVGSASPAQGAPNQTVPSGGLQATGAIPSVASGAASS